MFRVLKAAKRLIRDMKWFFKKDEMKASASGCAVFIARDFRTDQGKMVKQFSCLPSHKELADYILNLCSTGEDACIYELIQYDTACKLYFDVEWTSPVGECGSGLLALITGYVDLLLSDKIPDPATRVFETLKSSRVDAKGTLRHSYHIIYPYVTFSNNTVSMKHFAAMVHEHFKPKTAGTKNPIDLSVYSRDRLFRAPLCWKANDVTKTQMMWGFGDCTPARIEQSLITNHASYGVCLGKRMKPPPKNTNIELKQWQHKTYHSRCAVKKMCFGGLEINVDFFQAKLQKLLSVHGGMGKLQFYRVCDNSFSGQPLMIFRFEHGVPGREEPCLAHGICSKVKHRRDNQLVLVDENFIVQVVCPHQGKCNRKRYKMCQLQKHFFSGTRTS